jgi:acyltransferase-like protein
MNDSKRHERKTLDDRDRIHFLDNLRTFTVFLVVLCHAGGVYESSGIWASFWIVDDPATNDLSGLLNIILDIFMMPTLFFVSGYLAPASLQTKNAWPFLKSRFKRLMIPWIIAALTLLPVYKIIFLDSRNLPQEHLTTYFHWSNGIWCQNWLWFLPVLFAFNILYLLLSRAIAYSLLKMGTGSDQEELKPEKHVSSRGACLLFQRAAKGPDISVWGAVLATFLIGLVYSVTMDIAGFRGWTHTVLLDFQNEKLLIYFMAFLLGALCFSRKVFAVKPKGKKLYIFVNATNWIPITSYIVFLLFPWLNPGRHIVSEFADTLILWFSYQLALLSLVYLMIETFRRYVHKPGTLWKELNANSYSVYVIHVIVMGGFALALRDTALPSLWKYLILTASTFVASNLIVSLLRIMRAAAWPLGHTTPGPQRAQKRTPSAEY